ncbi:MAG: AAA family ATPase [Spirochaetales bacterium]|nr:AAA family ATPase [Spirochaetales bacterium]
MKFYNREKELDTLDEIYQQCCNSYGKITVLTGRRRIGKTLLAQKYASDKDSLYFFTSKKAEALLCEELLVEYEAFSGEKFIGQITRFTDLFEILVRYGCKKPFVLIIDEFQEFKNINKSVFSEIQRIWDKYKFETHIHIVFIGSIYSLMIDIFQNEKEPLYGRADRVLYIKPFSAKTIKEILIENNRYTPENLFYSYLLTGGVPRYIELFIESNCFSKDEMLDFMLKKDSYFLEEGKNLLIQEFGKDYGVYFSILEMIAAGKTSRSEMESVLESSIGGYLERLETEYDVIRKVRPVGANNFSRIQKYEIKDNFLKFWFRFVYKNMSLIQNERFDYVKRIIARDLATFSGPVLEKLFAEIIGYSSEYGLIGNYWEKGNLNEIDIVAIDDIDKKIYLAEVKMNKEKIKLSNLQSKSQRLLEKYKDYSPIYEGLSIEDIDSKILLYDK